MTSSLWQRFGELSVDVTAADVSAAGTLVALDPGRDILLGLFSQAITSELGAAWSQVVSSTTLTGKSVVQMTLPHEPHPQVMKSTQVDWPLLAVYRSEKGTIDQHTLTWWKLTQPWRADYILGPLDLASSRVLADILPAVAKVLTLVIDRRGHPDYNSGAVQFFDGKGHFASVIPKGYEMGPARFAEGEDSPVYWAMSFQFETTELTDFRDGFATVLEGAAFNMGVGDGEEILGDVIEADTDAIVP